MMHDSKFHFPPAAERGEGTALRAFAWGELAARLDAARDLRRELRRHSEFGGASFCDAAAGYFAAFDQGKPDVNPDALSHGNSGQYMIGVAESEVATGEREI